ncbi:MULTISPECIES: VOC family protein [unclassified Actinotalea]|uniref:VOC family protein n=1 Tax=unclassified Actinotalea TaxID=2638618 RepID=UPI0015F5D91A|nr:MULTISPECIES: VOC family protein [unclassified Actinotalea]
MGDVRPHLWFSSGAEEAAEFYAATVKNSAVTRVARAPEGVPGVEGGVAFIVDFVLDGMPVTAINAGPQFRLDEAFSFYLTCHSQEEVDHYWEALAAGGGEHSECGWLRDRWGVSWQVVPAQLDDIMAGPDAEGVNRAMQAMLGMGKLDIAALQAAYDGREVSAPTA